jgi:hypothetical protein
MAPKHLLKNDKKTDGFLNQSRPPFSAVFPPAADVGDHATLNDIIANPIEFVSTTLIPSIRQALIGVCFIQSCHFLAFYRPLDSIG